MKKIFVGNLDLGTTESSARSRFEPYGSVKRMNLVSDRGTGRFMGCAFVEMTTASKAEKASAFLNGTEFAGRTLTNTARPRPEDGSSGSVVSAVAGRLGCVNYAGGRAAASYGGMAFVQAFENITGGDYGCAIALDI